MERLTRIPPTSQALGMGAGFDRSPARVPAPHARKLPARAPQNGAAFADVLQAWMR